MKRLTTIFLLGFCFFSFSQTKEQDSLAIAIAFQKNDSAKVSTSVSLIKSLYKDENYSKALQYINQVDKLATQLDFKTALAEIQYYKGQIFTHKNDYYNAVNSLNRSKEYYGLTNNSLGIAKANNSIGLLEISRGNYKEGLDYSLSAIKLFEQKNLKKDLSKAYSKLADAYYNTSKLEKALEFHKKALNVRNELQDTDGIKMSNKKLADLYSELKEHRKAIEHYNATLKLLDVSETQLKADILPKIAEEYLEFNDYDKASELLIEGLKLNRETNNEIGILKSYNTLGLLNFRKGKFKSAKLQLDRASKILSSINDNEELLKNYHYRKQVDSALGNFKNAFYWQNKYYNLKKELGLDKTVETVYVEKPVTENTENVTNLVDTNTKTDKQTTQKAATKNYISYGLGAALLALSGVIFFLYSRQKENKDRTEKLEKENKKLALSNQDLIEESKLLEETNQVKDRLFSIVSHDLKDSVSSIKGFLDLLKDGSISKSEFKELIPELSNNADNASQLLLDLLNWSKTQMQNLEPKLEVFDVQKVFKNKVHLVEQKLEQKRVVLIDETKPERVYADKNMIEIVLQNLIANAIKFSRVGDVITISNRVRNGKVLLCVEDTGVGISAENQKKLFTKEAFTTRGTDNEKGTGLGLSICKELVELNEGRIWVQSEENFGSKFFIELPKAD